MRCKICDSVIDKPIWNSDLNDWEICKVCLDIALGCFEDLPDVPEAIEEEDDFLLDNEEELVYNIPKEGLI